jgi:membrane-associated phospholipid phosphatase
VSSPNSTLQLTDRLFAVYAASSGIALLFPNRPAFWPLLLVAHAVVVVAGLGAGPFAGAWAALVRRAPRAALVRAWYPLLLVPLLYAELPLLNRAVWGGRYFDDLILRAEAALFNGQPSREWAADMPLPWLSELLHASYLSYYLLIYGPPLLLYVRGRGAAFAAGLLALMATFFLHYLCFVYFPVQGPRYLFPAPGGPIADGFFYQLAHRILEAGSSQGAAFPSSHVGVSVAQAIVAWRWLPRLAPLITVLAAGLALGAVYGGFHYAIDATVGAIVGAAVTFAVLYHVRDR